MFCSKCGAKAVDGAVFCQKCGEKLIQSHGEKREPFPVSIQEPAAMSIPSEGTSSEPEQKSAKKEESVLKDEPRQVSLPELVKTSTVPAEAIIKTTQKADIPKEAPSTLERDAEIYTLLKENIDKCPSIKSAKKVKKGVRLRGRIYDHTVRLATVHTVQARIRSILAFPFSILYGLLAGLICTIGVVILQELVKYGSICIEYYHGMLFAFCCLVMGAVGLIHTFVGRKEKSAVAAYVRETVEPRHISLFIRKGADMPKIRIAVAGVLGLIGIIVVLFNLPDPIEYPDELLFGGLPVTRFLDMTQKDFESEFGEAKWINQNTTTGDDYYNYSYDGFEGIGHVIYSKENGKVIYIQFDAIYCTYNRKKLNKSLDRVLDILSERYKGDNSFGVYGSIHNGFYCYDGVYFGETPTAEEILAQQEFEDGRDYNYRFVPLTVFGEVYYDASWSLNGREKQDYKIDLITAVWKNRDDLDGVYNVCLYTDEWIETVNTAAVPSEQNYTSDSSNMGEVLYDGIPVSQFFVLSADELVESLGTPIDYDEYTLVYDDIEFRLDNGKVTSAESFSLGKFMVNGDDLEKGRDELAALLGKPSGEGEGSSGYQLEFSLEDCEIVLAVDEVAWRIWLTQPQYQNNNYGNLTQDDPSKATDTAESGNEGDIYGENGKVDLRYGEISPINLLHKSTDEVRGILGYPTDGTPVNGELLFGGTEYYVYDGLVLYFDNRRDTVARISVQPDLVKSNGETLDKNRTELIDLLGRPTYEGYYHDEMGELDDYYYLQYTLYQAAVIIDIEMPDQDGTAYTVTIYEYDDGPADDYWEEPYDGSSVNLGYGFEWVEMPYADVDQLGFDVIKGAIENKSGSTQNTVLIYFNLYDADGYLIDYASDSIQNVKNGDKWKFQVTILNQNVAYWEFSYISVY